MDHLDHLLDESSPTTYAAQPMIARELTAVTAHVARRRFRPIAMAVAVATLVLGAGSATAYASGPNVDERRFGPVDSALDASVNPDCVLYVTVNGEKHEVHADKVTLVGDHFLATTIAVSYRNLSDPAASSTAIVTMTSPVLIENSESCDL